MTVVKFPYEASRRLHSRKPRRSKNGTPEERAARETTATPAAVLAFATRELDEARAPACGGEAPNPTAPTAPGQDIWTTQRIMQKYDRLDDGAKQFMAGYIAGLADGRKFRVVNKDNPS
jgi:hypothetical protein